MDSLSVFLLFIQMAQYTKAIYTPLRTVHNQLARGILK